MKQKIEPATIARTIILFLSLVNTILTMIGANPIPFSEDEIYLAVSAIITGAVTVWAWWKNNSFTQPALKADEYMKLLKDETEDV